MDRLARLWELIVPSLAPQVLPDLVPVLLFILAGSAVAAIVLGDRLGVGVLRAYAWFVCLLTPMAYTLTAANGPGIVGCEWGVLAWESRAALASAETVSNVLLLVPAGAAAVLFPTGARRLAALGTALTLPFLIEFAQMVTRPLGRACQVSDVVNNTAGVLVGFCLAAGVWAVWVSLRDGRTRSRPPTTAGGAASSRAGDRLSAPTGFASVPPPSGPGKRPKA